VGFLLSLNASDEDYAMIVMKFGGTSVQDAQAISRVADVVSSRRKQKPVVVVSAMAKVTDALVAVGRMAAGGDLPQALKTVRQLRQRHFAVLSGLARGSVESRARADLQVLFEALQDVLRGIAALGELSPRTTDYVLSFGEVLSSRIVTAAFETRGLEPVLVDSRKCVVTDAQHTRAVPRFDETNYRLRASLKGPLAAGRVPVMGGFIAATADGTPTTLGRGGSDFSAAIVGAALGARKIEIWTDVDGMMTTDPRLCRDAEPIEVIGFDEAAELAYFGAKVLHPATLIPAIESDIPVYVLNSHNPSAKGTRIQSQAPRSHTMFRAIAAKKGIRIVNVKSPRMLMAYGFLRALFETFEKHSVSADLVSTSEISVSIAVDLSRNLDALVEDLKKLGTVEVESEKAIICLVGENVRGRTGMAAAVFATIAEGEINVHMITQGASEINISFVVEERDVPDAVSRLHRRFFPKSEANGLNGLIKPMSAARGAARAEVLA
jgi:aspartate kinase